MYVWLPSSLSLFVFIYMSTRPSNLCLHLSDFNQYVCLPSDPRSASVCLHPICLSVLSICLHVVVCLLYVCRFFWLSESFLFIIDSDYDDHDDDNDDDDGDDDYDDLSSFVCLYLFCSICRFFPSLFICCLHLSVFICLFIT